MTHYFAQAEMKQDLRGQTVIMTYMRFSHSFDLLGYGYVRQSEVPLSLNLCWSSKLSFLNCNNTRAYKDRSYPYKYVYGAYRDGKIN